MIERTAWLKDKRRTSEALLDAQAETYDREWGAIDATHRRFIERFLSLVPAGGKILDAACGTGKYWHMILEAGREIVGVDRSAGMLAHARSKHPHVPTAKATLEELSYDAWFDGIVCTDAMESVPPEDWSAVLANFRQALKPGGALYFTVETDDPTALRTAFENGRHRGVPLVYGEWAPEGRYHYYPEMEQVRAWLGAAGFAVVDEAQAPTGEDPYHHFLTRIPAG